MINDYRAGRGLDCLLVSDNLVESADKHLAYLLKKKSISHKGLGGSSVSQRSAAEGVTAFMVGEVVGYSESKEELFNSWLESPAHHEVIVDPKWSWSGVSTKEFEGVVVSVINFSTGILGSTLLTTNNGYVTLKGKFTEKPEFVGDIRILSLNVVDSWFEIVFERDNLNFIYIKNRNGIITDRVDLFF